MENRANLILKATDLKNVAETVEKSYDLIFIKLSLYPQLHLYVRDPTNIEMTYENPPTLLSATDYLVLRNLSKVIIVT
jgi:hypothetical protein